ncbi:MAG: VWA domain-containing protein [Planctomycetia bacterium]|nr:VWA domain-containing protein [Planctomycetia bacterium]
MTSFGDNSQDWLDDELRQVPVPEGLLGRLRELAHGHDDQLDAALRHVKMPKGLLLRLREIPVYADATLDAALCNVETPPNLLADLAAIAAAPEESLTFARLDEQLRDVPVPAGLTDRLVQVAEWQPGWSDTAPVPQGAERRQPAALESDEVAPLGPAAAAQGLHHAFRWVAGLAACAIVGVGITYVALQRLNAPPIAHFPVPGPSDLLVENNAGNPQNAVPATPVTHEEIERLAKDLTSAPAGGPRNWLEPPRIVLDQESLALLDKAAQRMAGLRAAFDPAPTEQEVLGGPGDVESQPRLVAALQAKGMVPAWKDADLLLFQIAHKVHPAVRLSSGMTPPAAGTLLSSPVPLITDTASFDSACGLMARPIRSNDARSQIRQRLAAETRPEEFLAALDYGFASPVPGTLALKAAGGVSPFADRPLKLLQIAVLAGQLPQQPRGPTHLTVAIDTGSLSSDGADLRAIKRALNDLIGQMLPGDQMSLVLCGDKPQVLVADAGPNEAATLQTAVNQLRPSRTVDVAEGLQLARADVRRATKPTGGLRRMILLTGGQIEMLDQTERQLETRLKRTAAGGTALWIIDVGASDGDRRLLDRLAAAGSGRVVRAEGPAQITSTLREALSNRPQELARGARLTVTFNPRSVASYRLIGHEATSTLGVVSAPIEVPLQAGDVCTGLFEIELRPGNESLIATAELTWNDRQRSGVQRLTEQVNRWQLSDTLASTPQSAKKAAVAAEAAELLRRSYFAPSATHSWARLRRVAAEMQSAELGEPTFQRLMTLVERAQQAGMR